MKNILNKNALENYVRILRDKADKPAAKYLLAFITFIEASLVPIPSDAFFMPVSFMQPRKAFVFAAWSVLGSFAGAIVGYWIGYAFMDPYGINLIEIFYADGIWQTIKETYISKYDVWYVAIAPFLPLPYQAVTFVSGAMEFNFALYLTAVIIGRAARSLLIAAVIYLFGRKIEQKLDKYLGIISVTVFLLLAAGFILSKLIF